MGEMNAIDPRPRVLELNEAVSLLARLVRPRMHPRWGGRGVFSARLTRSSATERVVSLDLISTDRSHSIDPRHFPGLCESAALLFDLCEASGVPLSRFALELEVNGRSLFRFSEERKSPFIRPSSAIGVERARRGVEALLAGALGREDGDAARLRVGPSPSSRLPRRDPLPQALHRRTRTPRPETPGALHRGRCRPS